jgi:pilus assembly protein Flp/PilA
MRLQKEAKEMLNHLIATLKDKKGQALSEYGLILALIAVIAIAALTTLGGKVSTTLGSISAAL